MGHRASRLRQVDERESAATRLHESARRHTSKAHNTSAPVSQASKWRLKICKSPTQDKALPKTLPRRIEASTDPATRSAQK